MSAELKLTAKNPTEKRVLDYLVENVSETLAAKINSGAKTLAGALDYCKGEARRMAAGEGSICVDDATVFGWVIHFFEEDHIEQEKKRPAVSVPSSVKPKAKPAPVKVEAPAADPQLSLFGAIMGGGK